MHRRTTSTLTGTVLAAGLIVTSTVMAAPNAGAAAPAWSADLRVDANRDGLVDLRPNPSGRFTDEALEGSATLTSGALFLPNLDDDSRRCPGLLSRPHTQNSGFHYRSDAALAACHDAADARVNGPADALDLAPVLVRGQASIPRGATGRVSISRGASKTRLFLLRGTTWQPVTAKTVLTTAELRRGIRLGLEGRDVVRGTGRGQWDGVAGIRLSVTGAGRTSTDEVRLRVAPLLAHHSLLKPEQVWVASPLDNKDALQLKFNALLRREVTSAKVPRGLRVLPTTDIWVQDLVEPLYATIPMEGAPGGRRSLRIILRSDQEREGNRVAYAARGRDTGVLWLGRTQHFGTLDSHGNTEVIPPYTHAGRSFLAGRIILGRRGAELPSARVRSFFAAQGVQAPLLLDTSFLEVGHVDEFVSFVPAATARGWRMVVADPRAAVALLRRAKAAGHGTQAISRHPSAARFSVNAALAGPESVVAANDWAARIIDANIAVLQRETGITASEIVRVPVLYRESGGDDGAQVSPPRKALSRMAPAKPPILGPAAAASRRAGPAMRPLFALVPDAVNALVLGDGSVLAAQQWSLKVGGRDLFEDAVAAAYRSGGVRVRWIDDFETYHRGWGDVHCGTNTLRQITPWWRRS